MNKFVLNKVIFVFAFVIGVGLIFSLTYAIDEEMPSSSMHGNIVRVDEEVYENLEFNMNSFNLKPILDKNIGISNNVIKLEFLVGGSKDNNVSNIVYDISLDDLEVDCDLLSPYLKWKLIKNGELLEEGSLDYKFDTIKDGRIVLTTIQQDLKEYSIDKTTYDKYYFYMWFSDSCQEDSLIGCIDSADQNYLLDKKINGKISIELNVGYKKELVRNPSETLDSNSCIGGMETDVDEVR